MNNYKIIATDLDGTLLNNQSDISLENMEAISEIAKRGVFVVPATGRSFSEIPEKIRNHPDIRYYICSNGSFIFDKKTGKKKTFCIQKKSLKEIFDTLKSFEVHTSVRSDGKLFVDSKYQTEEHFKYYNVCEAHCDVVRKFGIFVDAFEDYCFSADDVEVVSVFFSSINEKTECKKIIVKNENLYATGVDDYNLEIFDKDAGKGNALKCLADMVGTDYSQTISIGDSGNDMSITLASGLGLATSNACDMLKDVADEVICSNEENVMEYVLLHYISK